MAENAEAKEEALRVEKMLADALLAAARYESEVVAPGLDDTDLERAAAAALEATAMKKGRIDVQQVIKTPQARRLLWRILEIGGPYATTFNRDPYQTAFNEGKRFVATRLLAILLDADPNVYLQMQREHLSDLKQQQESKPKGEI